MKTEVSAKLGHRELISERSDLGLPQKRQELTHAKYAKDTKKKAKSAAVVFGFNDNGKATLLAGVTDDLIKRGLKAGDIVKEIAEAI